MSGINDFDQPEDVLPEDEIYHDDDMSLIDAQYQRDLGRKLLEQSELRALCIENGDDARKFLNSRFGQYLIGQAELAADKARAQLELVDPEDSKSIRILQNEIRRQVELETWIASAIEQGDAEYTEYLEERAGV